MPEPNLAHDNPYFQKGDYRADQKNGGLLQRFKTETRKLGLEKTISTVSGFLKDTLPAFNSPKSYAFVHIDLDLYDPVRDALEFFYPRLVEGGVLVIDDFFHHARGPARAAETYFGSQGIAPVYHVSFPYSVVLFNGEAAETGHKRAIDGNCYSFALLRDLHQLRDCVEQARIELRGVPEELALAEQFRDLLLRRSQHSADIYAYWSSMSRYWDDMDVPVPENHPVIEL